jgi:hypothetical protein
VKRTIKFFFGLALFVLGFQVSTLFFVLFVLNWEALMRDADTVSLVWIRKADYERLIAVLEEHGYSFEPLPPNTVAGDVIVYGDVRPLAQLIAEVGGGRVYVYTKRLEPSPQSFIPHIPRAAQSLCSAPARRCWARFCGPRRLSQLRGTWPQGDF